MKPLFGPAGNSDSFTAAGFRHTTQAPQFVHQFGLTAYEYQCGHGVRVGEKAAAEFRAEAEKYNIAVSLHAPYYISLSSVEEEKRENSIRYILQSAEAARRLGAKRIVVHSGSAAKISRQQALVFAKDTLRRAAEQLRAAGYGEMILCPETMGKVNQLGDLQEVMELCKVDDTFLPCIDFGHLNARTFGSLQTQADFAAVLDTIEDQLGADRLRVFHSHFSKIEYTPGGGEKRHLLFDDTVYGPDFEPLAELIAKKNLAPTFICESAGTQAEDAKTMQTTYLKYAK